MLIVLLVGVIKLPIAALMLWIPIRNDDAMRVPADPGASDEDGGSRTLPPAPADPHPRPPRPRRWPPSPRRGPHDAPSPTAPPRVRVGAVSARRLGSRLP
jgi:hypothetical protein